MIRGAELPPPLAHAFLDAIEAWSRVEHELWMTWQLLSPCPGWDENWLNFTKMSTGEQRKDTVRLVREHLKNGVSTAPIPDVFDRLVELTRTRDRIVHGRWWRIELVDGRDRHLGWEYIRIYDARGEPARPRNEEEEQAMLGRSRFYEPQLRDCEREFRDAARDLHKARYLLVPLKI